MYGKTLCCAAVLLFSSSFAESSESSQGVTFYERFLGSFNSLGAVTRLDSTIGYQFNSHISVDGGLPVYFVRPSSSTAAVTGTHSSNGIGNVYGQFRLTLANPALDYASTVTVSAPTGNEATGFSTGKVTADWSNYFEHGFGQLTPFAEIGIANSISDTLFFLRPYTTLGFVTHLQGGARYRLERRVSVGGSLYDIIPSGQQTVLSRLFSPAQPAPAAKPNGKGGVFQTASVTTGGADIARDHGFSAWLQVSPTPVLDFYGGYTRSTQFGLNTVFVGVGFNVGKAIRQGGI